MLSSMLKHRQVIVDTAVAFLGCGEVSLVANEHHVGDVLRRAGVSDA